ncbi:uncharacterized protein EI90DRAFT_3122561 [Cantharellus anzutake]|uniref:uncharacterized protein n=1 Tax=Cantharellus anzutake TaxID=1750568 RepID=UPI001903CC18|nr:uncharacterized protein EI90DRAFT_3122561 [Cantharellus anzutake]KAF8332816.1 hypothetical protein EI90DRAFT_3122561 [Cantharellus anzutake]
MSFSTTSGAFERPPSSFDTQPNVLSFESQVKASPFVNDLLDRLLRCEYSTKEIQRELGDVTRKVNFLVERALADATPNDPGMPSRNGSIANFSQSRLPGGNALHNQDEIRVLQQRINTLTTSVSQLLALQTQQHMNNVTAIHANGNIGTQNPNNNVEQHSLSFANVLSPSNAQNVGPVQGVGLASHQVHALPSRPEVGMVTHRNRAPPSRQWSATSSDLMQRSASDAGLPGFGQLIKDKRKASLGVVRRDSTSTIDSDNASGGRDTGPAITKWEQLPLFPDLLRSIAKYGVGPPNKIQQRALPFLLRGSDIIAQAPPTQERIAAYVIPAIHVALTSIANKPFNRGPLVVIISTTVDQATQAQRMVRDLGGPIGVRSALGVGTGGDVVQELRLLQQSMPHILCGTPQKLHALFTSPGGLPGQEVRFLVLDEVDQLIARNLHEFVFNIVKLFPSPRPRVAAVAGSVAPVANALPNSHTTFSPFDQVSNNEGARSSSPAGPGAVRFSSTLSIIGNPEAGSNSGGEKPGTRTSNLPLIAPASPERQTALFSNTVPQDVLSLANNIQLREPVRVLVRRDGNAAHGDGAQGPRALRQFYLYLAFTSGGRLDSSNGNHAAGVIGSGRGVSNAETVQAKEWKLDALADLFDDIDPPYAIVHVGSGASLDSVMYKLGSRGLDTVAFHNDMNSGTKSAALSKFRHNDDIQDRIGRPLVTRVLVVFDAPVKLPDSFHVPLVVNYDLPKAVEEYAHCVAPASTSNQQRPGVVVNFVTATGGDVEMLRSIECFYKIKCPEVPPSLRDLF